MKQQPPLQAASVYIIAEAGVNHNGSRDRAFELVDIAAASGANAVKFQTFDAQKMARNSAPKAAYQMKSTDESQSQLAMLQQLELARPWHHELKNHAEKKGLAFLSTAFDADSLRFLDELGMPLFKVPSGELTNGPLLWQFAKTGRPLILSTGMATLSEVEQALAIVAHALNHHQEPRSLDEVWQSWSEPVHQTSLHGRVTLLHCTSQYPTPFEQVNLRAMDRLQQAFGLPVGYSDHTQGILIPVAAVARGAVVIEKHFTSNRNLPGPDHQASLEPGELAEMVKQIRQVESAMGSGVKSPQPSEWDTRRAARQQIVAARDIQKDQIIERNDLSTARCGSGLPAVQLWAMVGTPARKAYDAGEAIT